MKDTTNESNFFLSKTNPPQYFLYLYRSIYIIAHFLYFYTYLNSIILISIFNIHIQYIIPFRIYNVNNYVTFKD
ncbi:hypothetical protein CLOHIR_00046 [Peptacetobacter hiranonis DSM 13275]|uniref:Uncharacterized protein n=1 Tax=Peptacetobacter hiranonis (strain DSM 13275 / JCM 10541 / KCTC 15199 / TO-931) TaxID=500633 RepID=B6FVZ7_PEPHT|nr:hypothetical protein CLOHIR_00046 [Peptacetobacter hiranonis DSM 13275]